MPIVEARKQIAAPIDRVWDVARDAERFPEFMPDVKSLEVIERSEDGNRLTTKWAGRIPQFGLTVRWTQEETWNPSTRRADYAQVQGDYDKLVGYWQFSETDGGTEFHSWLDYEYNVPLVGALLQKVVKHIVEQNIDGIMSAIKQRAEAQAA